ncbi:MAG: IS607 family transposase [Peptococcaceae bacterium]|nr:IS607 family transposase [Peptococcaceae bacterium]
MYSAGEAARRLGVRLITIQRWDRDGKLRVIRTVGGKRRISASEIERLLGSSEPSDERRVLAVYGRVSSHEQKARGDLSRQVAQVRETMVSRGWRDIVEITDVASGLSDKRQGLIRLMEMARQGRITDIAISYRDRLTRFGFGYLKSFFSGYGVAIHVVDSEDDKKSLQGDYKIRLTDRLVRGADKCQVGIKAVPPKQFWKLRESCLRKKGSTVRASI